MKKRFRNILNENRKKSGWYLLVAAALLTVSLGALIGCSAAREQPQESPDPLRGTQAAGTQSMDGGTESGGQEYPDSQSGNSDRQENPGAAFAQMAGAWRIDFDRTDPTLWGTGISYGDALEITETGALTYYIGIGVGGTGQCTEQDGGVTVEITPYEEHGAEQEILTLRYGNEGGAETIWMDWHGEDVYWVRSSVHAPSESIADSEEAEAFRAVVEGFVTAYFSGDAQTVASYLAGTCEQGAEVYEGEHEAADITVKGLPETDAELTEGRWNVSVEFREGAQADSFWYLTIGLIREPDGWKVQFYGLEG